MTRQLEGESDKESGEDRERQAEEEHKMVEYTTLYCYMSISIAYYNILYYTT